MEIDTNLLILKTSQITDNQQFLVARPSGPNDTLNFTENLYDQIARHLFVTQMEIVHERVFGSLNVQPVIMATRQKFFQRYNMPSDSPVTFIQGHPPWGTGLAGIQIQAVSCKNEGDKIWTIMDNSRPCGRGWLHQGVQYIILQNLTGEKSDTKKANTRSYQVQSMIERAERLLQQHHGSYHDVVRTWFYLSDILDWYCEFNTIRSSLYQNFGIMPGADSETLHLPASTGISGENIQGLACAMDLYAIIAPETSQPAVKQLTNRHQKDAFHYGSAFSRGALISLPHTSLIHVSGTAAIDETGQSQYPSDIKSQINCTLDKIATLLVDIGADLKDICSATVFVKHPQDIDSFWTLAAERGLSNFPCICVVAEVCRTELLFEIDAIAAIDKK
jgi:enamine deaminase RidA (YjgF/YER057c/UK114 family)